MPVRKAETAAKKGACAFRRWTAGYGLTLEEAAARMGVSVRTLGGWETERKSRRLGRLPRGRKADRPPVEKRNEIIAMLRELGPTVGMPTLMGLFPGVARGALWDLLSRFRELVLREEVRVLFALRWARVGSVWAMDFAEPPAPIDGTYGHAFAVRDLASGKELAWLAVDSEDASTVTSALRMLFIEHGVPLVIKADNGPGFTAEATRGFIEAHGAWLLLSPPHMPEYNGSAEAGIGSMKTRTHHQAALHDRPGEWTPDDLEAARCQANETARPRGRRNPTPDGAWETRTPITEDERRAFARDVLRWERLLSVGGDVKPGETSRQERDTLRRRALTTALFERGFLEKRRGRFTAPKAA